MAEKVNKTKFVGVYMEEQFVAKLKDAATADGRTLSSYIRKILEDKARESSK